MSDDKPRKPFFTVTELAALAKVSGGYIRRLLLDGKLRGDKAGRTWTIPVEEAEAWLKKREEKKR